ncbi:CAI-1 autoinducer sensor kinase/phosphatase CqsS [Burkholderiaceae bacterium]|nr:CAI-1 autoinducer sensor kinase/phosphatase CqsS [Burkholderiaceae bacterium]
MAACVTVVSDFGSYTSMPAPLGQGVRVLVVEDDPVQALVLTLHLERLGVAAVHVGDGARALDAVRSQDFAMVLMDVVMPQTNGIEATRAIRAWEQANARRRMPIVAVTASAMRDECLAYVQAGMNEVLVKPFSARDLRDVVVRHLAVELRAQVSAA